MRKQIAGGPQNNSHTVALVTFDWHLLGALFAVSWRTGRISEPEADCPTRHGIGSCRCALNLPVCVRSNLFYPSPPQQSTGMRRSCGALSLWPPVVKCIFSRPFKERVASCLFFLLLPVTPGHAFIHYTPTWASPQEFNRIKRQNAREEYTTAKVSLPSLRKICLMVVG